MKQISLRIIPLFLMVILGCDTKQQASGNVNFLITGNAHAQFDPCG